MRKSAVPSVEFDLAKALAIGTPKSLELWMDVVDDPSDRARQLEALSRADVARLSELLPVDAAVELIDGLGTEVAVDAVRAAPTRAAAAVLAASESDRAADVLRALPPAERENLLSAMPVERALTLRSLLEWPEESAAAHMVPEALTVAAGETAAAAIDQIRADVDRERQDSQIGAYVFAVDDERHLVGVVSFRDLVLADPGTLIADLVEPDVISVGPLDDQEVAARTLARHRLVAVPVRDEEGHLLGVITADDASDITEEEATEDAERQGGSQPLEVPYLRASPVLLWRKRIVWLLVLFIAEAYTGTVLRWFEDELDAVVALAFFIPLLIGTGGNTGTQITTTLIRAMSTERVRMRDLPRVIGKELTAGTMIALTMAAAGFVRAFTLGVGVPVMLTVAVALLAIVLWASLIASILPPLLKRLRIDPAVVSGPMIATIVDGTGLMIYFLVAKLFLPELAGM